MALLFEPFRRPLPLPLPPPFARDLPSLPPFARLGDGGVVADVVAHPNQVNDVNALPTPGSVEGEGLLLPLT